MAVVMRKLSGLNRRYAPSRSLVKGYLSDIRPRKKKRRKPPQQLGGHLGRRGGQQRLARAKNSSTGPIRQLSIGASSLPRQTVTCHERCSLIPLGTVGAFDSLYWRRPHVLPLYELQSFSPPKAIYTSLYWVGAPQGIRVQDRSASRRCKATAMFGQIESCARYTTSCEIRDPSKLGKELTPRANVNATRAQTQHSITDGSYCNGPCVYRTDAHAENERLSGNLTPRKSCVRHV